MSRSVFQEGRVGDPAAEVEDSSEVKLFLQMVGLHKNRICWFVNVGLFYVKKLLLASQLLFL